MDSPGAGLHKLELGSIPLGGRPLGGWRVGLAWELGSMSQGDQPQGGRELDPPRSRAPCRRQGAYRLVWDRGMQGKLHADL